MDKTGHREPLRGVLYNGTFHVAVTVDEGGTVCVWRMQVGRLAGGRHHAWVPGVRGGPHAHGLPAGCGRDGADGATPASPLACPRGRPQDGARDGRFGGAHGGSKVTALTLDTNERRLVTAANDATVHMWNFNNGSLLRRWGFGVGVQSSLACRWAAQSGTVRCSLAREA